MKKQEKSAQTTAQSQADAGTAKDTRSHMRIQKLVVRSSSITRIAPKSTLKKHLSSKI